MTRALAMFTLLALTCAPLQADETLDATYRAHAEAQGLDWRLVKAIAIVESNERLDAVHVASQSHGLVQILCVDDDQGGCSNRLIDVVGWPPPSRDTLFDPGYNLLIGTQILAWNLRTYGLHKGIAVYNQWSARNTPRGQAFPNQVYVDKVLLAYQQLRRVTPAGGGANNTGSTGREGLRPYSSTATVPTGPRKGL